jgi:hypothetical protein
MQVARAISIVGHPFLVVPGAILLTGTRGPVLYAVLASMVAITVHVVRGMRRGEISDVDVSRREQRRGVYAIGIGCSVVAVAVLYATHQPPLAIRGSLIAGGALAVSAIVNLRLKASLHCLFAMFSAGIAWRAEHVAGLVFAIVALAVAWARVAYERHTRAEAAVGLALGTVAAIALAV